MRTITNERLKKETERKLEHEEALLSMLCDRVQSPVTAENVTKWLTTPAWELEAAREAEKAQYTGKLRHLLPAALRDVEAGFEGEYFANISRLLADVPKNVEAKDITVKGSNVSYKKAYRDKRFSLAEVQVTEEDYQVVEELNTLRATFESILKRGIPKENISYFLHSQEFQAEELIYNYLQYNKFKN